jgi:hypothetical protein
VLTGIISRIFGQYLGKIPGNHDIRNGYTAAIMVTAHIFEKY